MIAIYKTLLNPAADLPIVDCTPRDPFDGPPGSHPGREVRDVEELCAETTKVRKVLRSALEKRYYCRYHPIDAFKSEFILSAYGQARDDQVLEEACLDWFKTDYVFEMIALLVPMSAFRDFEAVKKMVHSLRLDGAELRSAGIMLPVSAVRNRFAVMLHDVLWGKIKELAGMVAYEIRKILRSKRTPPEDDSAEAPAPKRSRVEGGQISAMLQSLGIAPAVPRAAANDEDSGVDYKDLTVEEIVDREIKAFRELDDITEDEALSVNRWWAANEEKFPCLCRVAGALLSLKPSSGALQCDIGSVPDIIGTKRASLLQSTVEVELFLKLNKKLKAGDTAKLPNLKADWKNYRPNRPSLPGDYFDEVGDEEDPSIN